MVEGVGEQAVAQGLMDEAGWAGGIRDLYRTAEPDGTFCYTFFKAVGTHVVEVDADDLAGQLAGSGASFTDLLGRAGD